MIKTPTIEDALDRARHFLAEAELRGLKWNVDIGKLPGEDLQVHVSALQPPPGNTAWEYRQQVVPLAEFMAHLQQRGREGWELVTTLPATIQEGPPARINGAGRLIQCGPQPAPVVGILLILKRALETATVAEGVADESGGS